ncbi:MAG TPA: metalloregulator ArsR/SmtB family transcription factor [Terriglobia bacterium]|nr:metalloregulator ArsR/SmtB family transcription factor [Terriglobia bacterium]
MPSRSQQPTPVDKDLYRRHADFCKVISHPTRLQIIDLLHGGEMSVTDLANRLQVTVGNLSQHLNLMKQRRVLQSRKAGNSVIYRLANPKMIKACCLIREILFEQMQDDARLLKQMDRSRAFEETSS